jgi:uncharacterized protein (DUF1330 family)
MAVYSISSINVKDWDAYHKYMKQVPSIIKKYGGKYLVRGGNIISDNTSWHPNRIVILEFPNKEKMDAFRNSEEYKPVAEIRKKAASTEGFTVEGYDE